MAVSGILAGEESGAVILAGQDARAPRDASSSRSLPVVVLTAALTSLPRPPVAGSTM
jgi:hypothetical protein